MPGWYPDRGNGTSPPAITLREKLAESIFSTPSFDQEGSDGYEQADAALKVFWQFLEDTYLDIRIRTPPHD